MQEASPGKATAANCEQMISDLDSLNVVVGPDRWYMGSAVEAHERVHVQEWKDSLNAEFPRMKSAISALSVPHVCGKSATEAKSELKALSGYGSAVAKARGDALGAFERYAHTSAATDAAERAVVDPMIAMIKLKGTPKADWPAACKYQITPPG